MALETYGGVSRPLAVVGSDGKLGYASHTVTGNVISIAHSFDYLQENDIVVVGLSSANANAVSASGLSITGVGHVSWNRLVSTDEKFQVFVGTVGDSTVSPGPINIPWVAGGSVVASAMVIRNVSAIDSQTTSTKSVASPWTSTSKPTAYANAVVLQLNGVQGSGSVESGSQYTPYALPVVSDTDSTVIGSIFMYEVDGKDTTASYNAPFTGALTAYSSFITFYGPTVDLDDLTFRLTETGTLLNNPDNVMPLYDVAQITGLLDSNAQQTTGSIDGSDGSYVTAKYLQGKTIVLDGTLYAPTPVDEALLDNLNETAAPTATPVPFFYKVANYDPRYIMAYPVKFTSQLDRNRALGTVPFQLQLLTESAFSYEASEGVSVAGDGSSLTTSVAIDVGGNAETYPRIYFSVGNSTKIEIDNPVWRAVKGNASDPRTALLTPQRTGPLIVIGDGSALPANQYGQCMLDLSSRRLFQLNEDTGLWEEISSAITTRQWFSLLPNLTNQITLKRTGGADAPNFGFSVAYENAWR